MEITQADCRVFFDPVFKVPEKAVPDIGINLADEVTTEIVRLGDLIKEVVGAKVRASPAPATPNIYIPIVCRKYGLIDAVEFEVHFIRSLNSFQIQLYGRSGKGREP